MGCEKIFSGFDWEAAKKETAVLTISEEDCRVYEELEESLRNQAGMFELPTGTRNRKFFAKRAFICDGKSQ